MAERDPIKLFSEALIDEEDLTGPELEQMRREVEHQVNLTYEKAASEAAPDPASALECLYRPPFEVSPISVPAPDDSVTMVQAINQVLHAGMERFPEMLVYGEDIEDPKGGVFGF